MLPRLMQTTDTISLPRLLFQLLVPATETLYILPALHPPGPLLVLILVVPRFPTTAIYGKPSGTLPTLLLVTPTVTGALVSHIPVSVLFTT
jgi:hypothetical protein